MKSTSKLLHESWSITVKMKYVGVVKDTVGVVITITIMHVISTYIHNVIYHIIVYITV